MQELYHVLYFLRGGVNNTWMQVGIMRLFTKVKLVAYRINQEQIHPSPSLNSLGLKQDNGPSNWLPLILRSQEEFSPLNQVQSFLKVK